MKVLIAPDSFKGTITAADAVAAIAAGWKSVDPRAELVLMPLADGGEGTLDAFWAVVPDAQPMPVTVTGPDGLPRQATWLLLPPSPDAPRGTGVVELASTSGIELLTELRPWDADTRGCGEAMAAALDFGVSRIIVGIGSSSSTDGGSGLLCALGARMFDASGQDVVGGARGLKDVEMIDVTALRKPDELLVVTDVTNPLTGPAGAAAVFGPQKGLVGSDIGAADEALAHFAGVLERSIDAENFGIADPAAPGTGAAGGTGFALMALGGKLLPGATEIARLMGFAEKLQAADVVVTGEGSYDGQSGSGKVPGFVAGAAEQLGVPVALVAGRIEDAADVSALDVVLSLTEIAGSAASAMADPRAHLVEAGQRLARQFQ